MNILGFEISWNSSKKEYVADDTKSLPAGDVAWSEDAIIQMSSKCKYNPDGLIGIKGAGIYKRMMLDEQVKAVVKFKRDAITSRDFYFEVDKNALSEDEVKRRVEIANAVINQIAGSPIDGFNSVMSAMWQGVSFTEKVFKQIQVQNKTYWGIKALKLKPFDTFQFDVDDYGNVVKLTQSINGRKQDIDIDKFIHHVQNPEYDAQYGQSELREAYRSWFSKDMAITFYNMWLERSASGFKWINTNAIEGTPAHTSLKKVLTNTTNGAGVILGKDDTFNIEFPAGNGEAFIKAIDKHDLGIARALLVPNLMGITPAGQTGSFSQSDTQLEAFLWTLDQEAARLEEVLNEQLFRQLGEINFGDEYWPRIRFQPISEKRKIAIMTLWKELIAAGAVKYNEADEEHIRNALDMPESSKEDDDTGITITKPDTALNGAQVTSMLQVVEKVMLGEITKESAKAILVTAYPIDMDTANSIIDPVEIREPEEVKPDDATKQQPNNNNDDPGAGGDTSNIDTDKEGKGENKKEIVIPDETVQGVLKAMYQKTFKSALSRVDFKVIQSATELSEKNHAKEITALFFNMTKDVVSQVYKASSDEELAAVKFSKEHKQQLQKKVDAALQESWSIGQKHAEREIDKAKGSAFSMVADIVRLKFIASEYFKLKSFKIAGKLSDDALSIISQAIFNGMKNGKTLAQIEDDIYLNIGGAGFLDKEDYRQALGAAIDPNAKNTQARIDTMLRTNGFEALNEARYSYFTDPKLGGFVQALEYSSVIDGVTTQLCTHLDGHVHAVDSTEWQEYRPPNHFNCRSLLIPVTEMDSWTESDAPTMSPSVGFK